jgi:hypothetical protein
MLVSPSFVVVVVVVLMFCCVVVKLRLEADGRRKKFSVYTQLKYSRGRKTPEADPGLSHLLLSSHLISSLPEQLS